MKRGEQNVEARPEAARRRKPCSKIEARLRQRRDKFDKIQKTSNFSPRNTGKKRDSEISSRSSITSSSDSEISPRFMTSKQHVELVNFENRKFLPVPRFRKLTKNRVEKIEVIPLRESLDESRQTNKKQCQTIVKKEENERNLRKIIKTSFREEIFESKIATRNPRNDSFNGNPSKMIVKKIVEEDDDALKKRRSRSAPCNPLFRIKCAKDKCPRNVFVDRKSLLGEKKLTEEIRECRKKCFRGLRISRSGEVAVTSLGGARMDERIVERFSFKETESRREDFETILAPKNLQASKLQRDDVVLSFLQKNTRLIQYEDIQSASNSKHKRSLQHEDIETSTNLINRQLLQQQSIEPSSNLENRRLIQQEDIESSSKPIHRQSLQQNDVESAFLQKNTESLQDEDMESSLHLKNRELLQKEDDESCSNPKNIPSVQQRDVESCTLKENISLLQDENTESSSDPKNTLILQKSTESSSNLINRQSLQQEDVELCTNRKNTQSLQQADIGSIFLPEDQSQSDKNHEKVENQEEIECKEEKNELHMASQSKNLNSKEEVSKMKTVDKAQEEANFVSQEDVKEGISRGAENPERRNELQKRCSPRKPPKKRAFKWETILEKQHQQSSSRSPENRKELLDIPTKIVGDNKFDFWTEKEANCSKHCRCPRSRVKSFEERKLSAYSAIREELPKILMKRRLMNPTMNPEIRTEAIKMKNWQKNLLDSSKQRSSPERPREFINRNESKINQRFMDNFSKRQARHDCSMLADSSKLTDPPFGQKITKNIDDSAKSNLEKNERTVENSGFRRDSNLHNKRQNPTKKKKIISDSISSPQNFEGSIGAKNNFGVSVPRRRKSPSPRRVTFRLPGRVIEENSKDEDDDLRNGRNFEKLITEECTSNSDNEENEETGWSEKNDHSNKKTEINYSIEQERSPFVGDELRKHDRIPNSCVEEKTRKLRSSNTLTVNRMENLQNMRWASPSCLAGVEEPDRKESDDSEQDWETATGEDVYRAENVTYPKETREAMKILMRAKENTSRCKHSDYCQKRIGRRDVFRQKEDYLRAEKSPEKNSTLVSSYANALAKFQEGCYLDSNRGIHGTLSQRRVAQKLNAAGGK